MLNIFISLVFLPLALAQFQFFEQMFGQQHPGQQPRQQQTGYPGQWAAHAEAGMYYHHEFEILPLP